MTMTVADLQTHLKRTGRYAGAIDGIQGMLTDAGILLAMMDGPDTALVDHDFHNAGVRLGVQPAAIKAFWKTEAAGAGFEAGRPKILPERHRFSKLTRGRFDQQYPRLSYPRWGQLPYPRSQDDRYRLLLDMVRLDLDAGFAACSYGAPQILGENYRMLGYASPFAMAEAFARDEKTQLNGFIAFVSAAGIVPHLRRVDRTVESWQEVARRYNGSSYRSNKYDEKMAAAFAAFGGK